MRRGDREPFLPHPLSITESPMSNEKFPTLASLNLRMKRSSLTQVKLRRLNRSTP